MRLKQIIDESFGDYKLCSMLLIADKCTWKCEGCQNKHLSQLPSQNFPDEEILKRFRNNPLTEAIVIGGLEPFEQLNELVIFIGEAIKAELDVPIVIYTGFEIDDFDLYWSGFEPAAKTYKGPVIVKFGRYVANSESIFNEDLGVTLISKNQYTYVF